MKHNYSIMFFSNLEYLKLLILFLFYTVSKYPSPFLSLIQIFSSYSIYEQSEILRNGKRFIFSSVPVSFTTTFQWLNFGNSLIYFISNVENFILERKSWNIFHSFSASSFIQSLAFPWNHISVKIFRYSKHHVLICVDILKFFWEFLVFLISDFMWCDFFLKTKK